MTKLKKAAAPRPAAYEAEQELTRQLWKAGLPVPLPVATHLSHPAPELANQVEWSVSGLAAGLPLRDSPPTATVLEDLAGFLATLHEMRARDVSSIEESEDNHSATAARVVSRLLRRWTTAPLWPFDNSSLSTGPLSDRRPDLVAGLAAIRDDVFDLASQAPYGLIHSDLHGEHIFQHEGRLSCVIDFGGAYASPTAWEFAAASLFLGRAVGDQLISSYRARKSSAPADDAVAGASIVFGLYRLGAEAQASAPTSVLAANERFVELAVERLI